MDKAGRFLYVALVPAALVALNAVIPVTAIVITTTLATTVALIGTARWRRGTERIPLLGRPLAKFARLGEYYEAHPPRLLPYYVAYPLLFPYWLFRAVPRGEFLVYRRVNVVALVVVSAVGAHEYVHNWSPDLPPAIFLAEGVAITFFQMLITMIIVMPIVTTVITFHRAHRYRTLYALAALSAVSLSYGLLVVHYKQPVPAAVAMRVNVRTRLGERAYHACVALSPTSPVCAPLDRPRAALTGALAAAAAALVAHPGDDAAALEAAHDALEVFYRPDEARAFRLFAGGDGALMLYTHALRNEPSIWLARDAHGAITHDVAHLPAEAVEHLHLGR